jgi:SAM-dependent methyltransferase
MKNLKSMLIASGIYDRIINTSFGNFLLYAWYRNRMNLQNPENLKLHLGCGNIKKKGFLNIDHRRTRATDMICDIRRLPFPSGSVALIESYHVIEHVPHPEVPKMLREWFRVLKSGGRLIIECPDFDQAVREYLNGNEHRVYNIFGLQRFAGDAHLFGYNLSRISTVLDHAGFRDIRQTQPTDYHRQEEPCMRIECTRE